MVKIEHLPDMRRLYCFRQVATSRSFRDAARQLGISQPVLTRHIQRLEEELGVTLVHRHQSGNKLTEAGQMLASRADALLSMAASVRSSLTNLRGKPEGTVTLALSMSHASIFLEQFLRDFLPAYPGVHLRIMEGMTRHVEDWIESGQVDVGVPCMPTGSCNLVQETLAIEDLFLINTNREMSGKPVRFAELQQMKLILPLARYGTRQLLENMAEQARVTLNPILEADSRDTIRRLVLSTGWSAIEAVRLFEREIAAGRLFARPIIPAPSRKIVLATSLSAALSSVARVTARELKNSVKSLYERPIRDGF